MQRWGSEAKIQPPCHLAPPSREEEQQKEKMEAGSRRPGTLDFQSSLLSPSELSTILLLSRQRREGHSIPALRLKQQSQGSQGLNWVSRGGGKSISPNTQFPNFWPKRGTVSGLCEFTTWPSLESDIGASTQPRPTPLQPFELCSVEGRGRI